uniref:Predicted protein n=1 Tax=Hordeum vulgare subsp. vulgare TaxID=112509 RepID=F2D3J1_HORVV|nr:predicted protein [Hordeum vulgare subsp. vulgare]
MKKEPSRSDIRRITCMVRDLSISVACTFAFGISGDPVAALAVLGFLIVSWFSFSVRF